MNWQKVIEHLGAASAAAHKHFDEAVTEEDQVSAIVYGTTTSILGILASALQGGLDHGSNNPE